MGVNKKVPSVNAALANGVSGHSMDLDDGHRRALGHPGVTVIPATLAVAESTRCSGKELLIAIIIGYELLLELARKLILLFFLRVSYCRSMWSFISCHSSM